MMVGVLLFIEVFANIFLNGPEVKNTRCAVMLNLYSPVSLLLEILYLLSSRRIRSPRSHLSSLFLIPVSYFPGGRLLTCDWALQNWIDRMRIRESKKTFIGFGLMATRYKLRSGGQSENYVEVSCELPAASSGKPLTLNHISNMIMCVNSESLAKEKCLTRSPELKTRSSFYSYFL